MPKKREDIEKNDRWNIESIFATDELWEKEFEIFKKEIKDIGFFRGKLKESETEILNAIEKSIYLDRKLGKLFTYAHTRHDEDTKNEKYKSYYEKAYNASVELDELSSYLVPELLAIEESLLIKYINSEVLSRYKFYLEKIIRNKAHILSDKEERIISLAGSAFQTASDVFSSLNDADMKFGNINIDNNEKELTHGLYYLYLIDKDRRIREAAFKKYHNKYDEFPTAFTSLLNGQLKTHLFNSKVRNFKDCLEASLFYKNIDTSVYTNLIDTVRGNINVLHKYLSFRKKAMGLDELRLYDVYIPFVESQDMKFSFDEAKTALLESVKILGDEYYSELKKGLEEDRWVDKYENENKRSGAYSTGCYDTFPFILLNFNGTLNDARTLAHEAGHSMHSYMTKKYQPPIYGSYPIFLAEVASTFNEELFIHNLLSKTKDKNVRAYLINSRLEEIRATFFRQTMFAEFELKIHSFVENDIPLTENLLKSEYRKLNEFYFGENVTIDKEIEIEWARIPHFYYNYYVYQYATGISAAIALFNRVMKGGEKEINDYLGFLKAGNSKFPLDILKDAGVDMTSPRPIEDTIKYFDSLIDELTDIYKVS